EALPSEEGATTTTVDDPDIVAEPNVGNDEEERTEDDGAPGDLSPAQALGGASLVEQSMPATRTEPTVTSSSVHDMASGALPRDASDMTVALPPAMPSRWRAMVRAGWLRNSRYGALGVLAVLALFVLLVWRTLPARIIPVEPVATEPVVQMTLNPPRVTATAAFPLNFPSAEPGAMLLVVAPFDGYTVNEQYNVAGRIQEALATEIANAGFISTTIEIWPEKNRSDSYLREVLSASQATLVIWGEYDSGRVRVNLNGPTDIAQQRDFELSSPTELITTITNTLPKEIRILALVTLGRLLRNQGEPVAAATALSRALSLEPGDAKTRALINFYLGHLAEGSRDLRGLNRAIDYYTRALAENPLLYDAQYNLGTVYLNRSYLYPADDAKIRSDLDSAIEALSTVIGVRPASLPSHFNRGVARYERHQGTDLADAYDDFSYVIAVDAKNSRAYFHRALTTIRSGEGQHWVADFEQTLALAPTYYPAHNGLCWGYALAQEPE
ncbi:MAG: tetratricopeptide repeat protein, partial [Caldilineaceae bacterium]|nr:tetratricopeptide repeat protein [Caldilineaceae bacterium]